MAAKRYEGDCVRLDASKTEPGIWEFSYSRQEFDHVAVGVSDVYGNEVIADVDDGSRRWAVQSEYAEAQSHRVNYDTTPTLVLLQQIAGSYVSSGTLSVDYRIDVDNIWKTILLEGTTPTGTNIQSRYKTADTQELLDTTAWSEYSSEWTIPLPQQLDQPWIRIEVLLKGTPTTTPELRSIEVIYDKPSISDVGGFWRLY